MAEWLCSGLQSRLRRFDSGFSLQLKRSIILISLQYARVVELVDTRDLKSLARNGVPVQVRLRVPLSYVNLNIIGVKINEFC